MSKINRFGDGDSGKLIDGVANDGTDPVVSSYLDMRDENEVCFCLFSDANAGRVDPDDWTPIALDGDLDGAWQIFASNDFVPASNGSYGQVQQDGRFVDITAQFTPTIQTVDHTDLETVAQFVSGSFHGRTLVVVFTPSSGDGTVTVIAYAKSH